MPPKGQPKEEEKPRDPEGAMDGMRDAIISNVFTGWLQERMNYSGVGNGEIVVGYGTQTYDGAPNVVGFKGGSLAVAKKVEKKESNTNKTKSSMLPDGKPLRIIPLLRMRHVTKAQFYWFWLETRLDYYHKYRVCDGGFCTTQMSRTGLEAGGILRQCSEITAWESELRLTPTILDPAVHFGMIAAHNGSIGNSKEEAVEAGKKDMIARGDPNRVNEPPKVQGPMIPFRLIGAKFGPQKITGPLYNYHGLDMQYQFQDMVHYSTWNKMIGKSTRGGGLGG